MSESEVYERMFDALSHIARIRIDLSEALDAEALFAHLNDAVKTARKGLELPQNNDPQTAETQAQSTTSPPLINQV